MSYSNSTVAVPTHSNNTSTLSAMCVWFIIIIIRSWIRVIVYKVMTSTRILDHKKIYIEVKLFFLHMTSGTRIPMCLVVGIYPTNSTFSHNRMSHTKKIDLNTYIISYQIIVTPIHTCNVILYIQAISKLYKLSIKHS